MNIPKSLVLMSFSLCAAACSSSPTLGDWMGKLNPFAGPDKPAAQSAAPANIAWPIRTTLLVYMTPKDLARQSRIPATGGNSEYWLEEGKLVQQAALKGFGKLFERVSPGKEPFASTPVAAVTAISGFNPTLGTQSADVTVIFTLQSEVPIGKLRAKSSAEGYEEGAFAKALDAAFQEIQLQFLKDPALVTAFAQPVNPPRVAAETSARSAPVAPIPAPTAPLAAAPVPLPVPAGAPTGPMAAAPARPATEPARATAAVPAQPAGPVAVAPQSAAPAAAPALLVPIQLPLKGELGIYLTAETLARQSYVSRGYSSYWLKEGSLIQGAAVKAFAKLFERVSLVEDGKARYPLVRVDGRSTFNAALGTRSATVVADFYSTSGQPIASLTARSSAEGPGEAGFEMAYDAAFRDLQQQFFENSELTTAFAAASGGASAVAMSPASGASSPPSADFPIPNSGSLVLYMAPEDLTRHTVIAASFGYASYWVEEGKIVQRAATKAFGRIFAQGVQPATRGVASGPVLKVQGSSSFNPIMKTYSSSVVATFSAPNGAQIGQFEAKATIGDNGPGDVGLEKAYDAAFQVIVKQLLAAGKL